MAPGQPAAPPPVPATTTGGIEMQPPLNPPVAASATAGSVGAGSIAADAAQPKRADDPVSADAAPPAGASAGVLDRVIDWSARNVFLVLLATLFLIGGGLYAVKHTPLDALPDLSDVQVIVYTDYPGQAPQVVEDQVTYPLTTSMLAVPRAKVVRGFSMFGASYVYVIFEDGTDIYWARSRVLEYLSTAASRLPQGVVPQIGPDATGVGWVYQYAVLGRDMSLADTRSLQDWYVRYQLTKAQGVSEVASIGGFVREYQVMSIRCGWRATASRSTWSRRPSAPPTATSAAGWWSSPRRNTWCAAGATCAAWTTSPTSCSRPSVARRCGWPTSPASSWYRLNGAVSSSSTARVRSPRAS